MRSHKEPRTKKHGSFAATQNFHYISVHMKIEPAFLPGKTQTEM